MSGRAPTRTYHRRRPALVAQLDQSGRLLPCWSQVRVLPRARCGARQVGRVDRSARRPASARAAKARPIGSIDSMPVSATSSPGFTSPAPSAPRPLPAVVVVTPPMVVLGEVVEVPEPAIVVAVDGTVVADPPLVTVVV